MTARARSRGRIVGFGFGFCCGLWLAAMPLSSKAADDAAAERQRIAQERAAAEAAHAARVAECEQRFVVTPCVNTAQRELRETQDKLRQQQVMLDEAQRRQRAALRIEAIRRKVAADEQAPRPPVVSGAASANLTLRAQPPRAAASASRTRQAVPLEPGQRAVSAALPARERTSRQAQKQAEMKAHREDVARREAARRASGKPLAAPLPVPRAASAAR